MPFAERNPPDLPILPGPQHRYLNSTPPPGKTAFHRSHSLGWKNGLRQAVPSLADANLKSFHVQDFHISYRII